MQNHSYENDFDLYENETACRTHFHCMISNRGGLGTSLKIMGLAAIDSRSQKEHTEIHKIPKFRVNQAKFD